MSRLIVKNLPKKVTQEQVETHFSQTGRVTDVKLKYKKDGEFRGFAFIGFESEETANQALNQFRDTFFKKNKITVERCHDLDYNLKKENLERSNNVTIASTNDNKYFKSAVKQTNQMTKEKLETLMNNPAFIQYLKLNRKGTSDLVETLKKKYAKFEKASKKDDEEIDEVEEEKAEEEEKTEEDQTEEKKKKSLANKQNISDLEYLQSLRNSSDAELKKKEKSKKWDSLFTVVVRTKEQQTNDDKKGKTLTKKGVRDFFRPLKFQSLRIPRVVSYVAYVGFKTEKAMNQALKMDKSFLDGVRVRVHKYEQRNPGGKNLSEAPWKAAEEKLQKEADPVAESGKLFVRNLWYSVTEEELKELFGKIGPIADLTLPVSNLTLKSKGFAYVSFTFPEHAVKAMNDLDGTSFKGRVLHILPSLQKEENDDIDEKDFKKKKEKERKKNSSSWHNWNSLFLGSGAVIDLFSEKMHESKYNIFEEKKDSSVAVNLALSETLDVEKTKKFLETQGVSLEAFSNPEVQRSNTVMLVKNLPAKTAASEIKELFSKFGELTRLVLPPSGVTAIIEFSNSSEAKRAFEGLAYTRFKWLPLYLEWAPIKVFNAPPQQEIKEAEEVEKPILSEENTTLYVKNLNFQTDEQTFKQHFSGIGDIASVLIAKRRTLSQGYGFVQFMKARDADKALRELQNSTLDGHALSIKKAEKTLTATAKSARQIHSPGEQESGKILVRNIPFQATWMEIRQLFQVFGSIKLVRLPKKVGSLDHRGFGFVEYTNEEDAKKAMEALGSSTHLYGRRLVLEWAKEEETVEEIRRKTADRFLGSAPPQKKQKIEVSTSKRRGDEYMDDT